MRENLNSIGWRLTHPADDIDLSDVLDACRDPELTRQMAELARKHWRKTRTQARWLDSVIERMGAWDGDPGTVDDVAAWLVDEVAHAGITSDEETGSAWMPHYSADHVAEVRAVLLVEHCQDGETRLRKALLVLWNDSDRVDRALKYIDMRHSRRSRNP